MAIELIKEVVRTRKYINLDFAERNSSKSRSKQTKTIDAEAGDEMNAKTSENTQTNDETSNETRMKTEEKKTDEVTTKTQSSDEKSYDLSNQAIEETTDKTNTKTSDEVNTKTNDETTKNSFDVEKQSNTKEEPYQPYKKTWKYVLKLDARLTKPQIKILVEKVFKVKVVSVNTYIPVVKKKELGLYQNCYKSRYKRAIVKLLPGQELRKPFKDQIQKYESN